MKDRQRRHWDAVADGWREWLDWTERNFQPLTVWLARVTEWQPGTRVLDVACGAGYPALAAARAVSPGEVLAIDLSPQMIAAAAARADAEHLNNVAFAEGDAEHLMADDCAFDVVTNTFGLMFCSDPARALVESYRVLTPGGRIAVATWDTPSRSPFFTAIRDIASTTLGLPTPPDDEPHPFRLADSDTLRSLLETAGFVDSAVLSLPMTFECETAAEYGRMFADLVWKARAESLTPAEKTRFDARIAEAVRPFIVSGRLQLVATALCAFARKPPATA